MNEAARMGDLERKVEGIENSVNERISGLEEKMDSSTIQVNESIKALTDNVNKLCERDIRADERRQYEDEWKGRVESNQKEQGQQIRSILDERNKESQGREFVNKWWPWLLIIVLCAGYYLRNLIK
ncbi:TMhelix containing protein [Vibrio phage 1.029.O._10N.261.55.A7]|nr:TMhelix containing protein [Vibrio phage 1.029.O._10N.261.55.A7]